MPQQQYIKYLYEQKDLSISQISASVNIDWRTASKYAKKDARSESPALAGFQFLPKGV